MSDIQQRSIQATVRTEDNDQYIIEGYAALFQPYLFSDFDDVKVYEKIERSAFEGADMSDFSLKVDHVGPVYARIKNGTLKYKIDSKGLFFSADLSKTSQARELYEAVKAGMYPTCSYAFTIAEEEFDKKSRTRIIKKFKKIYDVSVCDFGANQNTSVYARSWQAGVGKPIISGLIERKALVNKFIKEVQDAHNLITNR